MQHGIGTASHSLHAHLPARRVKQRQDFGNPVSHVFVRLTGGLSFRLPTGPALRNRLKRAGLVGTPDGQSQRFAERIGVFN